jgi:alanine dehydrogenase
MTSTIALTNATLPYAIEIADKGIRRAALDNPEIAQGVNIIEGRVTYPGVAEAFGLKYQPLAKVLQAKTRK